MLLQGAVAGCPPEATSEAERGAATTVRSVATKASNVATKVSNVTAHVAQAEGGDGMIAR